MTFKVQLFSLYNNWLTMSNVKLEVQWSPAHANKFITWGTEICLYEVARIKDTVRPSCKYIILKLFVYV